jgi:hypothetical protein
VPPPDAEQERVVEASGLEWTLVKPPRPTDDGATGSIQAGPALPIGLMSRISRRALAEFILDEVASPHLPRARVFVNA